MTISHLTLLAFLLCFFTHTKPHGIEGFSIKLIPLDRFDTTLFPKNLTQEERYRKIYELSRAHIWRLESKVSSSSVDRKQSTEDTPNALQPVVTRSNINYYLTTFSVGAHSYAPNLVVDTGSVDTWMQCDGCTNCFFLKQGNFNKSRSRSYRPLPCDDPLCDPRICKEGICMYHNTYIGSGHGDTYSKGEVGSDTFIFNKGSPRRFPNTVFGCGLDSHNFPWEISGQNNVVAGIFGLGLGKRSIFMQYVNETKSRISYCLPSYNARGAFTYLHFGDDAEIGRRRGTMTTKLIPNVENYAVKVIDISIDKKRLHIDPAVFRMRSDGTGGFILDSGSPHTALVQTGYTIVKEEIKKYFLDKYGWQPLPPQPGKLELCYTMSHRNFTAPTMTYHFEGASIFLPDKNVFLFLENMFCWLVMPISNRGPNILGALQQANYRFLFDFRALTVSFIPELCRFNG